MVTSHEDIAFLADALAPLCAPLHDTFGKAHDLAEAYFVEWDMTDPEDSRDRTDLCRTHARRLLKLAQASGDLGGWELAKLKNGQTMLRRDLLCARILHVAPNKFVPGPGTNQARISYFRNPPAELYGVEASRLLALWSVDPETGEVAFRIVRPTEAWKYGDKHISDVDIPLPRESGELKTMEFVPDDAGIQLPFDLGNKENYYGLADGW